MSNPTEIICDTLIEFLDRLAIRRGRDLYPQNSTHRKMIGFIDAETGEWVLVEQALIRGAEEDDENLKQSCARFGLPPAEVLGLLQTPLGVKTLIKVK